jgi:hypothetical protein
MVELYQQGKAPDSSTRALWQACQQSRLLAKQVKLAKEIMNFA